MITISATVPPQTTPAEQKKPDFESIFLLFLRKTPTVKTLTLAQIKAIDAARDFFNLMPREMCAAMGQELKACYAPTSKDLYNMFGASDRKLNISAADIKTGIATLRALAEEKITPEDAIKTLKLKGNVDDIKAKLETAVEAFKNIPEQSADNIFKAVEKMGGYIVYR